MTDPSSGRRGPPPAILLAWATFILIGWVGLLSPSLIRSIKDTFEQTDAGIGIYYFIYAVVYATGSLGGGLVTEHLGRRAVLTLASAFVGIGLALMALAPGWELFLLAALPTGLGVGALDGGMNGLVLDLAPTGRGKALNLLHTFFSIGALSAPLVVGRLVEGGLEWTLIFLATGFVGLVVAVGFALVPMPTGRRGTEPPAMDAPTGADRTPALVGSGLLTGPVILLAIAIGAYVASEVGISNWLVRFLEPAPLSTATTALSLFWAGLATGRFVSSRIADRFDHIHFAATAAAAMGVLFLAAIFAPSLWLSIALFALAGFASGPVFPMIIAIGGDRYPERSSAVSGFLTGAAVTGSIIYPPVMGFLSVTVGLTVAMTGGALLGFLCAGALLLVQREPDPEIAKDASAALS